MPDGTDRFAAPAALRLIRWVEVRRGSLAGFATVELNIGLRLFDLPVFATGTAGPWVGLPRKPQLDRERRQRVDAAGQPAFEPVAEWRDRATSDRFSAAVLAAIAVQYPEALGEPVPTAAAPQPQRRVNRPLRRARKQTAPDRSAAPAPDPIDDSLDHRPRRGAGGVSGRHSCGRSTWGHRARDQRRAEARAGLRCRHCRRAMTALSAARKYCCDRCRAAAFRKRHHVLHRVFAEHGKRTAFIAAYHVFDSARRYARAMRKAWPGTAFTVSTDRKVGTTTWRALRRALRPPARVPRLPPPTADRLRKAANRQAARAFPRSSPRATAGGRFPVKAGTSDSAIDVFLAAGGAIDILKPRRASAPPGSSCRSHGRHFAVDRERRRPRSHRQTDRPQTGSERRQRPLALRNCRPPATFRYDAAAGPQLRKKGQALRQETEGVRQAAR